MSGYKNKFLLISTEFPPGPGGIGNHAYNLAKHLNLNGHEITVMTVSDFSDAEAEKNFDDRQRFKIIRFSRFKFRLKTYRERIRRISEEVKNNNYTHIIFSGRFSLYSSLFLRKLCDKIKFIAIAHGGDINANNAAEKAIIKKALSEMDLIIPVSNYSASKIPVELKDKNVSVIPNGFDFEKDVKVKERTSINKNLNLVTVGTVWPRKGHHNVLKAFPQILKNNPELKYNIAGRLADLSKIQKFTEDVNMAGHIKLHGLVTNDRLYEILNESDIFIMLSETQSSGDFEGFGIAVIEANYFGLPAIGSKNSGLEDAICSGVSGLLVNPDDPDEISEAIEKIKNNYPDYSKGAKQWAEKHHWGKIVKRYEEAIENIK